MQSDEEKEALAPCPWCGGAPIVQQDIRKSDDWRINCRSTICVAACMVMFDESKEQLMANWNTRAPDLDLIRRVARDAWASGEQVNMPGSVSPEHWIAGYILREGWKK